MKLLRDARQRGYAALAILSLLAIVLLGPFVVNDDARHLSAFKDGEEDASLAFSGLEGKAVDVRAILSTPHVLADLGEPHKALLVVLGSERRYDPGEAEAVVDFIEKGGSIILADEGGFGSDVARHAGFAFGQQRVLDTQNHLGDPKLVSTTGRVGERDFRVLFNAPTNLIPLSTASDYEVLASSSRSAYPEGSYLDTNDDGAIDINDQPGPFPLVVRTSLGDGTLILVSDTGLFMNRQTSLIDYQNVDFVSALADGLVPGDGVILVDEARHAPPAGVALWNNAARTLARLTSGLVAPLITLTVLLAVSVLAWRFTRETEDWSHHDFDIGRILPLPAEVRPDLDRAQRMARRRISEKYNIPPEQVAAMPAEQLLSLTGDKLLAEAAAGTLKGDPNPLFKQFSQSTTPPEATS